MEQSLKESVYANCSSLFQYTLIQINTYFHVIVNNYICISFRWLVKFQIKMYQIMTWILRLSCHDIFYNQCLYYNALKYIPIISIPLRKKSWFLVILLSLFSFKPLNIMYIYICFPFKHIYSLLLDLLWLASVVSGYLARFVIQGSRIQIRLKSMDFFRT